MPLPRSLESLLAGAVAMAAGLAPLALGCAAVQAQPTAGPFSAPSLAPSSAPVSSASSPQPATLLPALETALNSGNDAALAALLQPAAGFDPPGLLQRVRALRGRFPDARWQLTAAAPLRDGRRTMQVRLSGQHREGPLTYQLEAEQLVAFASSGGRLSGEEVIREHTILRSGDPNLRVSLLIPDAVLTGQRYDVDAVFDDPLEGAVVAGGLAPVSAAQAAAFESPELELGALGGGGLFKTVQAPYSPGIQTWAMLLVHPKGVVSATKRVRVVGSKAQLSP